MLLIVIIGCFILSVPAAFSAELRSGSSKKAYSPEGELVGTVKKEKGRFVFYDKDEIHLKKKAKNEWKMFNQEKKFVGILKKGDKYYKFYDKQEKLLGLISLKSRELRPRGFYKTGKTCRFRHFLRGPDRHPDLSSYPNQKIGNGNRARRPGPRHIY